MADPKSLFTGIVVGAVAVAALTFFPNKAATSAPAPKPTPAKKFHEIPSKPLTSEAVSAWAALKPKEKIQPWKYEPRPLGENDVEIQITHCGICHSDIHQIDNGWANASIFPMVPGHEIVGIVSSKGSKVTNLEKGDRVGVGAQVFSCLQSTCSGCSTKYEQTCPKGTFTYNSKYADGTPAYGGYSTRVRVHSTFALKIPSNLKSEEVAPLFCAGATVFEPMKRFNMGKGHSVGVTGIGGLGHLAIQFARALGCTVTAISSSANKKDLALKLGAHSFISTPEEKKAAAGSFDFILQTDSNTTSLDGYLAMLKPFGGLVLLGVAEEKIDLIPESIIFGGRSVHGSIIASPSRIQEMLELASKNNIAAMVEVVDISKVNEAIEGVRQNKPRFRYVLKIQDVSL